MMTVLLGGFPVFSILPVIDLPLPLVVVGGVILAIASNRTESSQIDSAQGSLATKDTSVSSQVNGATQNPQSLSASQQNQKNSGNRDMASPSLPNLPAKRDRPISPKISPMPPSTATFRPVDTAPSTVTQSSSKPADPQLPTFITPTSQKTKRVSFTIETKKDES